MEPITKPNPKTNNKFSCIKYSQRFFDIFRDSKWLHSIDSTFSLLEVRTLNLKFENVITKTRIMGYV